MYNFDNKKHAHTLDGKPLIGTSTVLSIVAKPLTYWAAGLAVEKFGWLNPKKFSLEECANALRTGFDKVKDLDINDYAKLLDEAYRAHATKLKTSASDGTDLHEELESYVKSKMSGLFPVYSEKITPFVLWAEQNVKRWLYSESNCYSRELWLGGISDAGCELNDGSYAIIDFKSSKEAYDSQFWQIAGYDMQISENGGYDSKGNLKFTLDKPITQYIVVPFGAEVVEPVFRYNVEECKEAFKAALTLYKISNK